MGYRWFGRRLLLCWVGVGALGVAVFLTEFAVAAALRDLFRRWGEAEGFAAAGLGLCGAFLLRGLLQSAQPALESGMHIALTSRLRRSLVRQTLAAETLDPAAASNAFFERIERAGEAAAALQQLAVSGVAAALLAGFLARETTLPLLPFAGGALLLGALFVWTDRGIGRRSEAIRETWERAARRYAQALANAPLIRIHGLARQQAAYCCEPIAAHRWRSLELHALSAVRMFLPYAVGLPIAAWVLFSSRQAGMASAQALPASLYLLIRLLQKSAEVARSRALLLRNRPETAALAREWPSLGADADAGETDPSGPTAERRSPGQSLGAPSPGAPELRFEGVAFRYPGQSRPVLEGLDLRLPSGSWTAIQGISGAGKSTLLQLVAGRLRPEAGAIRVLWDGAEAREAPLGLEHLGYAGPDPFLIEGTILENLAYGLDRAPDAEEIERALQAAACEFVRELPGGLAFEVRMGSPRLSSGQQQRLALARALLRRPRLLLLDEATSFLDAATEQRVLDGIAREMARGEGGSGGRMTVLSVSHREATFRPRADQWVRLGPPGQA